MQEKSTPLSPSGLNNPKLRDARVGTGRSNADRSAAMRADLLAQARSLFVRQGYADTSTPDIVAAAGVTRGALYHHFADKQALFEAVVEAEAAAVAAQIQAATAGMADTRQAILEGARAYFQTMQHPGRCRLLLIDGPAVLGHARMQAIDMAQGGGTLREGLYAAMQAGQIPTLPVAVLALILSGLFDRAALMIDQGLPVAEVEAVFTALLTGLWR